MPERGTVTNAVTQMPMASGEHQHIVEAIAQKGSVTYHRRMWQAYTHLINSEVITVRDGEVLLPGPLFEEYLLAQNFVGAYVTYRRRVLQVDSVKGPPLQVEEGADDAFLARFDKLETNAAKLETVAQQVAAILSFMHTQNVDHDILESLVDELATERFA
jgi:hypothetical protein